VTFEEKYYYNHNSEVCNIIWEVTPPRTTVYRRLYLFNALYYSCHERKDGTPNIMHPFNRRNYSKYGTYTE